MQALNGTSTCSLWLNQAVLAKLPSEASRHNTPSRSHALTKIVTSLKVSGVPENVFVVSPPSYLTAIQQKPLLVYDGQTHISSPGFMSA